MTNVSTATTTTDPVLFEDPTDKSHYVIMRSTEGRPWWPVTRREHYTIAAAEAELDQHNAHLAVTVLRWEEAAKMWDRPDRAHPRPESSKRLQAMDTDVRYAIFVRELRPLHPLGKD